MTRPRDDDAIWMLTNVGSIDTPKNNYKTCKNSDKKVIRSSFITNLRSEDHNSNSVKCWCSQCSKKRLCNNLKKDLLFISSDLLDDYLRQYDILEWKIQRREHAHMPSFQSLHPNICEHLEPELIKPAKNVLIPSNINENFSCKSPATTENINEAVSSSPAIAVTAKPSSNIPKSIADHTILKNLENTCVREHGISKNVSTTKISMESNPLANKFSSATNSSDEKVGAVVGLIQTSSCELNKPSIKSTESINNQSENDKPFEDCSPKMHQVALTKPEVIPTKLSAKIRARYKKDMKLKKQNQQSECQKNCNSSPKSACDKSNLKRKESVYGQWKNKKYAKNQIINNTRTGIEGTDESHMKSCIKYPIANVKKPHIAANLMQAQVNIFRSISKLNKTNVCLGSNVKLSSQQKLEVFENNDIKLDKHLTVNISTKDEKAATMELLKQNKRKGIFTPREIALDSQINGPHSMNYERRHSSDSDSGVDVSIEGLINGIKPLPPIKEPITCNLCSKDVLYQSEDHLWIHQKSKHMDKDCTKENVFPIENNRKTEYYSIELKVGPDMSKFDQRETSRPVIMKDSPVWVCFECDPPKIIKEENFNSHAEELLHFEKVKHYGTIESARKGIYRQSTKFASF